MHFEPKTFRGLHVFGAFGAGRVGSKVADGCIFFLTFFSNHLIYESHCDFFGDRKIYVRRIKPNEERNEESRPEEESCPEEEREVAGAGPVRDLKQVHSKAPRNRGLFICAAEES